MILKLLNYIQQDYKCGSRRKTPLNRETPEMDNPVLSPQEIEGDADRLEVIPNK